ncbi:MFS general substrate transporter [Rickenella mellea]|uniref:MFS general substrate transporter n=1 Tax=Rickenella mellea TaxID=50990 RepID=A0A4Y7PXE9_9AGAM|nr:MFS general substrate transporter [Rickenella mellea]
MPLMPRCDEETPLLSSRALGDGPHKETSLPWRQFRIVLIIQFAESVAEDVISPLVPQLIKELGVTRGDDMKIGYYVGMIQSIFFASQALTILSWSRLSDEIGRKPIILVGLFGHSSSMYIFGLSRSLFGFLISRFIAGALNGNIGVVKSLLAELTDHTKIAHAFAYQPIAQSSGATVGYIHEPSIVGGENS